MGEDVQASPLGEVRVASTAGGGTALTTTASFISLPRGTNYVSLTARNVAGAAVIKYAINPYLLVIKATDNLLTAANMTDGSYNMQDADTATTLVMDSFNTAANNNYLYIGARALIRGVRVIIGNTNSAGGSTATVKYRKSDNTWTAVAGFSDGTKSTDTFRQTGNITWTVPTDAIKRALADIMDTDAVAVLARNSQPAFMTTPMYWFRYETDTQFDASVTATGMQAMSRSTTYGEFDVGVVREFRVNVGPHGIGCLEALTDAGTANLIVDCATLGTESEFI